MIRRVLLTLRLLLQLPIAFLLWALVGLGLPFSAVWLYWRGHIRHIWSDQ